MADNLWDWLLLSMVPLYVISGVFIALNGESGLIWLVCAWFIYSYYRESKRADSLEEKLEGVGCEGPIHIDAEPEEVELNVKATRGEDTQ